MQHMYIRIGIRVHMHLHTHTFVWVPYAKSGSSHRPRPLWRLAAARSSAPDPRPGREGQRDSAPGSRSARRPGSIASRSPIACGRPGRPRSMRSGPSSILRPPRRAWVQALRAVDKPCHAVFRGPQGSGHCLKGVRVR